MKREEPILLIPLLATILWCVPPVVMSDTPKKRQGSACQEAAAPKSGSSLVLVGRVLGPDGTPVDGVQLRAAPALAHGRGDSLSARTDSLGLFRIKVSRQEPYVVWLTSKGLAPAHVDRMWPGVASTIRLNRGEVIVGIVSDDKGSPIANATIMAISDARLGGALGLRDAPSQSATSDRQGSFRLEGIGPGLHTIAAVAKGSGRCARRSVRAGASIKLVVTPGTDIRGTVIDVSGRPVKGAVVRAELQPRFPEASSTSTVSSQSGHFELWGIPPGTYTLVVDHPDYGLSVINNVQLGEQKEVDVSVTLDVLRAIVGRLVDGRGRGMRGSACARVYDGVALPPAVPLGVEADIKGQFRLDRLAVGSWTLEIVVDGHAPIWLDTVIPASVRTLSVGNVVFARKDEVRGRVETGAGTPVGKAYVAVRAKNALVQSVSAEVRSRPDGSFEFAGLEPGSYTLTVRAPGFGASSQLVHAGTADVSVVLTPSGSLAGVVVDEADQPFPSYMVFATPDRSRPNQGEQEPVESAGTGDGRFLLHDVVPGSYVLEFIAPDRAPAVLAGVKVVAGATTDAGTIRLPEGGTIRGLVIDGGGTGVPSALVEVIDPRVARTRGMDILTTRTDPGGLFELRGVPTGIVMLVATHPDYSPSETRVSVESTDGPADATLVMSPGGRIEGVARRRDGAPLSGLSVEVQAAGPSGFRKQAFATRPDGSFSFSGVPPGEAMVTLLTDLGPGQMLRSASRSVVVQEGETASVELVLRDILLTGKVVRSGTPLSSLDVRLWSAMGTTVTFDGGLMEGVRKPNLGPQRLHGITSQDGTFEMLVDEPGSYWVQVQTVDERTSYPGRMIEVPDGDSHFVEIALSGLSVAGEVVDRQSGLPVAEAQISARPLEGEPGSIVGLTETDIYGHFSLDLEPGPYVLVGQAEQYASSELHTSVEQTPVSGLLFKLVRDKQLLGNIRDFAGRPVSNIRVQASSVAGGSSGSGESVANGMFRIGGLGDEAYNVCAGNEDAGYAIAFGVRPAAGNVDLVLRPGGEVHLQVRASNGLPVAAAHAAIARVGSARISLPNLSLALTDESGRVELASPAGEVEVAIRSSLGAASIRVMVPAGGTVREEVTLPAAK